MPSIPCWEPKLPFVRNTIGAGMVNAATRGSEFLATPGFGMESRWDKIGGP